jgi:WD40 repeat protein
LLLLTIGSLLDHEWKPIHSVQAHGSEVNDIALKEMDDGSLLAISCGRDRMIQVLRKLDENFDLLQTIEQHGSSVNKVTLFDNGSTTLISLSSDRTAAIHTLAQTGTSQAFICLRILTLKSTPLSCIPSPDDSSILIITTTDKQIQRFQLRTGLMESSIKLLDEKDPIALQSVTIRKYDIGGLPCRFLLGVSAVDKSIRVHDLETGQTISKDAGHSEGLTDAVLIQETLTSRSIAAKIVTTSLDGTVRIGLLFKRNQLTKSR